MKQINFADSLKNKLFLNLWISLIRFLYVLAVFVLVYFADFGKGSLVELVSVLNIGFVLAVVLGIFVTFTTYSIGLKKQNFTFVKSLSVFQIMLDLLIIFLLYKNLINIDNGFFVLYFIPILYSIILFRAWVPFVLSLVSVILISNFFIYGVPENIWLYTAVYLIGGIIISIISMLVDSQRKATFIQAKELSIATHAIDEMKRITKAQEVEIREVEGRLNKFDQAKSDFITLTTHELRTPLSAINWALDLLRGENDRTIIESTIEKAEASVKRMNNLIDRIILIGKETDTDEIYNFSRINLLKLIEEVAGELSAEAGKRGVEVSLSLGDIPEVLVDAERIKVVFEELLQNALTYTPKGGTVLISIDTSKLNTARSSVDVVFSDTGIGIKEEDKDKIFERFYRGGNAIKVETDGTGLGLYVVRQIVAKHGGTIWFENRASGGTSFHVELPISQNRK